ncbi:endolytic transglycosylase MltG [Borrelia anserina]|uniref:Endolytic murein transglycosylase n=2 Tax=Borrelia anserina TaxID=143 RepID=W5SUF0_BORAN|nr:endolytic transglycosylase MltG [Borrelia anserina]AHH08676.1 Putative membrane associated protein [Borrelia anserina BA2]APR65133.1 aminodeoxychorismate lyase [Borrelia anserina Es]UPA07059.1 endolytic transglycosylase MltG [Borrelia anserina]
MIMRKIFIFLCVLFIICSASAVFLCFLNSSPLKSDLVYEFEVQKGWGVKKIAWELKKKGLIRSDKLLIAISYLFGSDKNFRDGKYLINGNCSTFDVYKEFLKGRPILPINITIPEGYTGRRIALKLHELGIISDVHSFINLINDVEFISKLGLSYNSLEGFLFPDTYKFYKDMDMREIIQIFVGNFFSKLGSIGIERKAYSSEELYNKVIVASIVEREYRVKSEAPIMASVFYNRIKSDMALQSCATIEYIITEELRKPHPERIYFADLEINSVYNTYINKGYPPSPISNAGIVSLKAAFFPDNTNYLFFVVKDPKIGTHKFSSDYSDHLLAANSYIRNFITKD